MTFPAPGVGVRFSGASIVVPLATGVQSVNKNTVTPVAFAPVVPVYDTDNYFLVRTANGGPIVPVSGTFRVDVTCYAKRLGAGLGPGSWSICIVPDSETPFNVNTAAWSTVYSSAIATGAAQSDPQLLTSRTIQLVAGQGVDLYVKWEGDGLGAAQNLNGLQSFTITLLPGRKL
ncbi:MAG: hypothetical protein L3K06_01945 [Thermoplasmata archaeon]|nr:hypothetical protein [Thermoplasmata archaeon]